MNPLSTVRKIRACENEAAAQLLLERYAMSPQREPDPGQQWKCGDEFLPFHPQASHVPAEYRDGWNRCYWMAVTRGVAVMRHQTFRPADASSSAPLVSGDSEDGGGR